MDWVLQAKNSVIQVKFNVMIKKTFKTGLNAGEHFHDENMHQVVFFCIL